jgi:magnesium-transporting ATPase (P-type)
MTQAATQSPTATRETPATPWHALPAEEALRRLGASEAGLDPDQAARLLVHHGPNVLRRKAGDGPLRLLWRQIDNPLVWVLTGSAALAIALGKITDGLVVLAVIVLNTILGFLQEFRASRAIEALARMVPESATVLRAGRRAAVPVADLVPGDVVLLASGDKVPADLRLVAVKGLRVDEAALTGESVPVEKGTEPVDEQAPLGDRTSLAYSGTLVTYGTATGLVVATGGSTELGRISAMLQEAVDLATPLTRALARVSGQLTAAILATSVLLVVVGTARATRHGLPMAEALRETVVFSIALAVGAIPEGLPAIVTIALAIGVQRMAKRRAIIRKLPAVETLGSVTVICSDKTGTLTRNEMTVLEVWTPGSGPLQVSGVGYEPRGRFARARESLPDAPPEARELLRDALLCSDATLHESGGAWSLTGDPTEAALVVAARKAGLDANEVRRSEPRRDAIPFESENQFMATLHAINGGARRLVVKGAPEVLLARCVECEALGPEVHREVERLAARGMRVLALADKPWASGERALEVADASGGLMFRGLVGMIDPPRAEAVQAVRQCHEAGIVVKMITGDHHATARAIGAELGLVGEGGALTGVDLAAMDDRTLRDAAARANVFARVAPEHKLRLVRALQADCHVVAMTGDGVNDAPALKQADIGVAMGITGTAVSKESADVVLTDDNFASIVAAVEEGRRVYDNLVKSLAFVLPTNLGLALILVCAVAFFPFDPATGELLLSVQPTQLLWINLVASVALALPLAFERREPDAMRRPPRRPDAPLLGRFVLTRTVVAGLLMTAGSVGLFLMEFAKGLGAGEPPTQALHEAQTMAVTAVIMFQVFYVLECRSLTSSLFRIGLLSNPVIFAGIGAVLALQAAFIYAPPLQSLFETMPLSARDVGLSALAGALILPVLSLEKWLEGRRASGPEEVRP